MDARYDVVVIGGGPAGEVCAGVLGEAGLRVALVERELVGGECSYWACMPTKTLLRPAEAVEGARLAPGAREAVTGSLAPEQVFAWRDRIVHGYDDASQLPWLEERGVELVRGRGRLAGPGRVTVGDRILAARHVVVATGSEPVVPPIPGLRELEGVWTNREVSALREVPGRVVILGAGAVGVEMAQFLVRLGAEVALAEAAERVLFREPAAVGEALGEILAREGVELMLGCRAVAVAREGEEVVVRFADGAELRGDHLLVATGRAPRVRELGLETVGIQPKAHGIAVDERLRAGDGVWAIGDVNGIMAFTHVGKYQGRVAANDILGRPSRADYRAVPRVVFTDPQIAVVGEGEGAVTGTARVTQVPRAYTYVAEPSRSAGFLTLVSDGVRLTGAHAVGPEAGEWLQQATLAVRAGVPVEVLVDTIQPFPTFSEIYLHALEDLVRNIAAPDAVPAGTRSSRSASSA